MHWGKNIFIFTCMVVVAVSASLSAWSLTQISIPAAVTFGVSAIAVMLVGYMFIWRAIVGRAMMETLQDLMTAEAENTTAIQRLTNEVKGYRKTQRARIREEVAPFADEVGVLSELITDMAQTISVLQDEVHTQRGLISKSGQNVDTKQAPSAVDTAALMKLRQAARTQAITQPTASTPTQNLQDGRGHQSIGLAEQLEQDEGVSDAILIDAFKEERFDLHLQSTVQLPQRKSVFYEAFGHVRLPDNSSLNATDYLEQSNRLGLTKKIDHVTLTRIAPVLTKLGTQKNHPTIFVNVCRDTLQELDFFDILKLQLDSSDLLAKQIVLEVRYEDVLELNPIEQANIESLRHSGFRFSIDNVPNLTHDFRQLRRMGFSFIKIGAHILLEARDSRVGDIHPVDLATLLARNGLEMIIERVETEAQLVDLLDFNSRYGQGNLFGKAKMVRPDIWRTSRAAPAQRRALSHADSSLGSDAVSGLSNASRNNSAVTARQTLLNQSPGSSANAEALRALQAASRNHKSA